MNYKYDNIPPDKHPAAVYLASLPSEESKRTRRQVLNQIAAMLGYPDMMAVDWSRLRYKDTEALYEKLSKLYVPATVNKYLSALRSVLKYAYLLGQMSIDDYQQAIEQIKLKKEERGYIPVDRELSYEEITALIQACNDGTHAGTRDVAIISLLYAAGLRPTELVRLEMSDYKNGELFIKGAYNKQRIVFIDNGALEALQDWLSIRGDDPGPLFFAITSGGNFRPGKKMTSHAVGAILDKRAESAELERLSPGDLRRSFINHLLDAGADIVTVSKLAGNKDVRTTARYYQRGDEAERKAAKLLHVPYKKR